MKKKGLLVLALVLVTTGGAFAQSNSLWLDMMPLLKGFIAWDNDADVKVSNFNVSLGYERLVATHFSIGADVDLYINVAKDAGVTDSGKLRDINKVYFGLGLKGRCYPLSDTLDKLFIGAGIGFNTLSVDKEDPKTEYGGFSGLTTELRVGWRALFSHFLMEPSIAYAYSKNNGYAFTPLGWQGGLRIGFAF